jgi:hypothetical protein
MIGHWEVNLDKLLDYGWDMKGRWEVNLDKLLGLWVGYERALGS